MKHRLRAPLSTCVNTDARAPAKAAGRQGLQQTGEGILLSLGSARLPSTTDYSTLLHRCLHLHKIRWAQY